MPAIRREVNGVHECRTHNLFLDADRNYSNVQSLPLNVPAKVVKMRFSPEQIVEHESILIQQGQL